MSFCSEVWLWSNVGFVNRFMEASVLHFKKSQSQEE
jgi:hypothetical protein